jgi:hypothetical protein
MTRTVVGYRLADSGEVSSSRRELIEIQKAIVEDLKREIRAAVGRETSEYRAYLDEYNREFRHYERCSRMQELLESLRHAGIVYNGDYHTMPQAQRIPLRILRRLLHMRPAITLAVEAVRIEHQCHLDNFLAGRSSESEFLEAIGYERTWGFPWEHYRDLFLFARERRLRVVGINSEPSRGRWRLKNRDRAAARVIAKEVLERPQRLVYVFDGDLHIAPTHLPAAVDAVLADFGVEPRKVIIYQNNEHVYWDLARHNREQETDVVLMSRDKFCVMSTPPVIKFQSYLNWIDKTRELASPSLRGWQGDIFGDEALYNQMLHLIHIISQFLEIEREGLDDFAVHSPADLDFLYRLRAHSGLSREEVEAISAHIRSNESCFIEKGKIIYIANLSINHAAEEATHFINHVCAGPRKTRLTQVEDFYFRIMREALGFFGSKIINHKRPCYSLDDFKYLKRKHPTKPAGLINELSTIGKHVAGHRRRERRFLSTGSPWRLRGAIYDLPLRVHLGVTHALGYMLGERLFRNMLHGHISKAQVKDLFFRDFSNLACSFTTYLDLISPLGPVGNYRKSLRAEYPARRAVSPKHAGVESRK